MSHAKAPKGYFRFSGRQLLASLVFLLVAYPFFEDVPPWGNYVVTLLLSFVLISSLLAVGGRRTVLLAGLVFIAPAVAMHWLSHVTALDRGDLIPLTSMALAIGFTVCQLLRFILRTQHVDSEVLCSGISIYLLIGLLWAYFYLVVDSFIPGAFSTPAHPSTMDHFSGTNLDFFEAVYYSFSALTTAGGAIVPVSRHARSLSSIEAVCGVLYVAVLISRLVSLYSKEATAHSPKHAQPGP